MSLEQAIVTIGVALIATVGGILVERVRARRDREKEINSAVATIEQARLADGAEKRKELDDTARDIRDFLRKQVAELNEAIDRIELARAGEREKWHQMLGEMSTKNLELELQHRRDMARIEEMLEEAKVIDDEVRTLRTRIMTCESEATVMSARLDQCRRECEQLRKASDRRSLNG